MITAVLTGDDKIALRLQEAPSALRQAISDSMKRQWFRLQAAVVTQKLSGDPLHRRTGLLASSINVGGSETATEFTDDPLEIVGKVGTKVRYGFVHENGGTFGIPAHMRTITTVFGRAVAPHHVEVRAHNATFPQRSFLRSTLEEMRGSIIDNIKADVAAAAKAI